MHFVFDIGGTKMRMAFSNDGIRLMKVRTIETPRDFETALPEFRSYIEEHAGGNKRIICLGLPGVLDKGRKSLISTGHLPFWVNQSIKEKLTKETKSDVFLENDASLAALGETVRGAGMGRDIVGYLTIGTGVGGGRVVNGKLDLKTHGFEPGFQIVDADGTIAGLHTDLDSLVGGAGIEKRFGKKGEELKDPHIWSEIEKLIGIGVANAILFWSPEVIVLGGSIIQNEFISIGGIDKFVSHYLKMVPKPEIKKGILGDHAGLCGGLEYLKQEATPL